MVPVSTLIYMFITLILSTFFPLLMLVLLWLKYGKGVFKPWIAGAIGFFVPQVIIRIPALQFLGRLPGFGKFVENNTYLYMILLALTAALFETAGRLIVFRIPLKNDLSYACSISAGAGHGGIESIILVGMTYINNIVYSFMINTGTLSLIIKDADMRDELVRAITGTQNTLFLLAGFERIFTMVFHVFLSVLMVMFIIKGKTVIGTLIVILLHGGTDFIVVWMQYQGYQPIAVEGFILVIALVSFAAVLLLRKAFGPDKGFSEDPAEAAVREGY